MMSTCVKNGETEPVVMRLQVLEESSTTVHAYYEFHLWNSFLCEVGLFRGASRYHLRAIAESSYSGSWPRLRKAHSRTSRLDKPFR